MFRTRDYVLMLSATVFLLVGIVSTLLMQGVWKGGLGQFATAFVAVNQDVSYEAKVTENASVSREDRIAQLKKKIATLGIAAAAPEEIVTEDTKVSDEEKAESVVAVENRCAAYNMSAIAWNPAGIKVEEVEGARIAYRSNPAPATSTSAVFESKQILLQLALPSLAAGAEQCIPTDVIGITTDGHLIKNNQINVFKVFKQETLIGYALDGFPIYGVSSIKKDICGGVIIQGQYRYQLDAQGKTMINCFAGVPVSL